MIFLVIVIVIVNEIILFSLTNIFVNVIVNENHTGSGKRSQVRCLCAPECYHYPKHLPIGCKTREKDCFYNGLEKLINSMKSLLINITLGVGNLQNSVQCRPTGIALVNPILIF